MWQSSPALTKQPTSDMTFEINRIPTTEINSTTATTIISQNTSLINEFFHQPMEIKTPYNYSLEDKSHSNRRATLPHLKDKPEDYWLEYGYSTDNPISPIKAYSFEAKNNTSLTNENVKLKKNNNLNQHQNLCFTKLSYYDPANIQYTVDSSLTFKEWKSRIGSSSNGKKCCPTKLPFYMSKSAANNSIINGSENSSINKNLSTARTNTLLTIMPKTMSTLTKKNFFDFKNGDKKYDTLRSGVCSGSFNDLVMTMAINMWVYKYIKNIYSPIFAYKKSLLLSDFNFFFLPYYFTQIFFDFKAYSLFNNASLLFSWGNIYK